MPTFRNSSQIETLIADAARVMPILSAILDEIAAEMGAVALMGPLKSRPSILTLCPWLDADEAVRKTWWY